MRLLCSSSPPTAKKTRQRGMTSGDDALIVDLEDFDRTRWQRRAPEKALRRSFKEAGTAA